MGFKTVPVRTDMSYYIEFVEPQFNHLTEEERIRLLRNLIVKFNVKLEELKFDVNSIAKNNINFTKMYDDTYLEVGIGIEVATIKILKPKNANHAFEFFNSAVTLFEPTSIKLQEITEYQHLASEENIIEYLKSLNPNSPKNFEKYIKGMGVQYNLQFEEGQNVLLSIADSILYDNAIYFSTIHRQESYMDIERMKITFIENRRLILQELGLEIEEN